MGQENRGRRRGRSAHIDRRARKRCLTVDRLEERTLLAVVSNFAAGVLTVSSNAGDAIVINRVGANVLINGLDPDSGVLAAADVTTIDVTGGPLGNLIDLSGVAGGATGFEDLATVTIDGAAGDDTIIGSALADSIDGGLGNDQIFGFGGDDTIRGGGGNDTLVGGQGNDQVFGGTAAVDEVALLGLDATGRNLVRFSPAAPGTIASTTAITGIPAGETIVGIDARPATGELYALTNQGGTGRLYTIDPTTGAASAPVTLAADPADLTDPYTTLAGASFGIDFNPVVDRLRVVSDADQNLRINVTTGLVTTDGEIAFANGGPFFGVEPTVVGAAYINAVAGAANTTLFTIDTDRDSLFTQEPPNNGTQNLVGPLGVDATAVLGFDILPGAINEGLASLVVDGVAGLYRVSLITGEAELVDEIGTGATPIGGLTVLPTGDPLAVDDDLIIWNNGDGSDTVEGGVGDDTQRVNGSTAGDNFAIAAGTGAAAGRLAFQRTNLGLFSLDLGGIQQLDVFGVEGDDTVQVGDLATVDDLVAVNLFGGDGNDAFAFDDAATLINGQVDGGDGSNTISYFNYTTAVTVDLSTGAEIFRSGLSGDQATPPNASTATGRGSYTLDTAGQSLTFEISYENLQGQLLGAAAPFIVNQDGDVVRTLRLDELGGRVSPNGTFAGNWNATDPTDPLTPELVEQLRDGQLFIVIPTTGFPGGEIRGRIVATGSEGSAPGVTRLANIQNVIGGRADDTITGGPTSNSLQGAPGSDTITGGGGDDTIIWNDGDGSDVVDGGDGIDTQVVNGGDAAETFEVVAGAGGRLLFRRTDPNPFSLDIGTVEGLELDAGLGDDSITVGDLSDVDDLTRVDLDGGSDNDTIDASDLPSGEVTATLRGGPGNDSITGSAGDDSVFGGSGDDTIVGGRGADQIFGDTSADDDETTLLGLDATGANLLRFSADDPTTVVSTTPITGIGAGETLVGFDTRPGTGALIALTNNAGVGTLYTIDPDTGVASDPRALAADPADATDPYTELAGTDFGFDFNPVPDRLRVVSDADQSLRINVDTGLVITDGDLNFADGDANEGEDPAVSGSAYANSFAPSPRTPPPGTTLYGIDATLDILVTQNPPNDGTLNTVGGLGVDATAVLGFDILPVDNRALASLVVGGATGLYEIDLDSGEATLIGAIDGGTTPLVGLTVLSDGGPLESDDDLIIWNNGDGSDVIDGGAGEDTQRVNGAAAGDIFEVSDQADGRVLFRRTNLGQFSLDIGSTEILEVNGLDGDDQVDASGLGAESIRLVANGGEGNDTLIGGAGDDTLDGGPGNNLIIGNGGRNTITNGRVNPADYDGDGITDYATYTPGAAGNPGLFEVRLSTTGETISRRLGGPNAFPIAGDYDGDGLTDIATYEFVTPAGSFGRGRFTIIQSTDGTTQTVDFGGQNDFPIAGDYDGDGRTDIAVYGFSPDEGFSRFGVIPSSTDQGISVAFGGQQDFPVAGDFDNDGRTDFAVYGFSPANGFSRFGIVPSSQNATYTTGQSPVGGFPVDFGGGEDVPVGGDYDGDGITDLAVYGPQDDANRYAIVLSGGASFTSTRGNSGTARNVPFGEQDDQPVGGDFTGDNITDLAVFGPGSDDVASRFLVRPSEGGNDITTPFGGQTSRALPLSSSFFVAVPDDGQDGDDDGDGTATAARKANAARDAALASLSADEDGDLANLLS